MKLVTWFAGNDQKEEDAIIFYNDTVIIRSVAAQHRALSIHRFLDTATAGNSGSHNSNDYESDERAIGFYRTWTGSCEKFIILPGNCSNLSPFTSISSAKNQKQKQKQPVCIGDMLMLRSFATGDILKVQPTGSFKNEYSLQLGRFNDDRNSDGLFQVGKADQAVNPPWLMMRSAVSSDDNESSSINYKQHDQPMYLFQKHLTDGFYADQQCSSNDHICLSKDLVEQEEYIIRNLLDALTGFSSNIFVYCAESSSFQISQKVQKTVDISFAHLSRRILPMCDNFVSVQNYVSSRLTQYEHGLVAQALASAMDELLQEYLLQIIHLESLLQDNVFNTQKLSLQKVWCFLHPSMYILEILANISCVSEQLKGGALLNCIESMLNSTADEQECELLSHLLNAASIPYFDILHKWIYIGQLNDVYEEFMVSDNKHKLQDASKWWNDRFTLHEVNIWITFTTTPTFSPSLNHGRKSIPEIILTVGKYLNLIHECSRDFTMSNA